MEKMRSSNLEILRILCILAIIGDHFTGQSGIVEWGGMGTNFFYCAVSSLSRVACSVFIIISAWFSVDKVFKFKKIVHVWITVVMYTVPIILYCTFVGIASKENIFIAFMPIEESPLWFAGYYIVLVLLSPMLNLFLNEAPKRLVEYFIAVLTILLVIYNTLTVSKGFFAHDIWILMYLYVLTGYIKKYRKEWPSAKISFMFFSIIWFVLTMLRAVTQNYHGDNTYIMNRISAYCEAYRANLQTIPNLLMAYTAFFGFYGLKIKNSRVINTIASATLGVYCFHQVPIWYSYLWHNIFKSTLYSDVLHGIKRMIYTLVCILTVWFVGTTIEIIRLKIAGVLVENRKYCFNICSRVDNFVNGNEREDINNRNLFHKIVAVFVIYVLLSGYISGIVPKIFYSNAVSASENIVEKIDFSIEDHVEYVNGNIKGYVSITNHGSNILDLSVGATPVNLGISILDAAGNMVDQDYIHLPIKETGVFKTGEKIDISVNLINLYEIEKDGYSLRFEIVQEDIAWIDKTAKYWSFDRDNYILGKELKFNCTDNSGERYFVSGLSHAEDEFTWTDGNTCEMHFNVGDTDKDLLLTLNCGIYGKKQEVIVEINGENITTLLLTGGGEQKVEIANELIQDGILNIVFYLPDAQSPKELGESEDARLLGLRLYSLSINGK